MPSRDARHRSSDWERWRVHTITEQAGTRRGSIGTDRRAGTLASLGRSAAPPDGEQTRSSTYIDDCIQGTVMIAMGSRAEPINLGSSELVTINQLVDFGRRDRPRGAGACTQGGRGPE